MDGLSAVASGIAVFQLAVQLAESFKKICDFWKSIEEAPEEIQAISGDLNLLSSVLIKIAQETQHVEPDTTLIAALNGCRVKVKTLTTLLNEIEPGFASKSLRIRKWTAFKAVLKHRELTKFQEALERLKSTLLLVQQNEFSRLSRNRQASVEWSLATITQNVSSLSVQQRVEVGRKIPSIATDAVPGEDPGFWVGNEYLSVPKKAKMVKRTIRQTRSVIEGFIGTIRATSTIKVQTSRQMGELVPPSQDQYEHKMSYTIYPAPWLVRLGVHYGLHFGVLSSPTQGWKNTINTFCPVPDDALIFEFCRQGNVPAVRNLLSAGHASVRDTDSRGYTPLHVAAENHCSEVCQMLKCAGADINAVTHNARTPMSLAAFTLDMGPHATLLEVSHTLRLLSDSMDFSDKDSNDWEVLVDLCFFAQVSESDKDGIASLLLWILKLSSLELKINIIKERFADVLYGFLCLEHQSAEVSEFLLKLGGHDIVDTVPHGFWKYPILHSNLALGVVEVKSLLALGPNLHKIAFDADMSPYEESPTSLAMYSARAFTNWLDGLSDNGVDLETFIDQELAQNSKMHPGWEKETMLNLFTQDNRLYFPVYNSSVCICSDCQRDSRDLESISSPLQVQPYWRHLLDQIRERRNPRDPTLADSDVNDAGLDSYGEDVRSSSDVTQHSDTTGKIPCAELDNLPCELESEDDSSEYSGTKSVLSDCSYKWDEVVCMRCWIHYKSTGHRLTQDCCTDEEVSEVEDSSSDDEASDCEYSPFHIHS